MCLQTRDDEGFVKSWLMVCQKLPYKVIDLIRLVVVDVVITPFDALHRQVVTELLSPVGVVGVKRSITCPPDEEGGALDSVNILLHQRLSRSPVVVQERFCTACDIEMTLIHMDICLRLCGHRAPDCSS